MRIFLTGADGQLGHELQRVLRDDELLLGIWPKFDVREDAAVERIVAARPGVVIHTAAYTDVDGAEREPETAWAINAEGTERVARAAAKAGARLITLSTDYVFDGRETRPYTEEDPPNPLNAYGRSKLEGERRALAACSRTLVVRTAWLYGRHGKNFVTSIMRQASSGIPLRVVVDQRGCPTAAPDLAEAISYLLRRTNAAGILHAVGAGDCTWHEFAEAIVQDMGVRTPVMAIRSEELSRPAVRPAYAVLSIDRLAAAGYAMPPWRESLTRFIKEQVVAHAGS
ncbi:MAG TPA: dTDP-4-dehydrorhamnose reductase [Nitrospirales bacterium]|nr:dTDP-4-dehydrorhamnose reductase [Nitrospirales bacterium]